MTGYPPRSISAFMLKYDGASSGVVSEPFNILYRIIFVLRSAYSSKRKSQGCVHQ